MLRRQYDAIVLGSGQAGTPLAMALAKNGWATALIERAYVGGSCTNTGCTPTKTLIANARVAYLARRSGEFGVHCKPVEIDFSEVIARKDAIVKRDRDGLMRKIEQTKNLDLIRGEGQFAGAKMIEVRLDHEHVREVEADTIFINTGTRPAIPPIAGIERVPVLDEEKLMNLDTLPEHLMILGAGSAGLEFAQMFCRFGSQVTVIEVEDQLLPGEDEDIAETMLEILSNDGIDIHLSTQVKQVEDGDGGHIRVKLRSESDGDQTIAGSHLLVAVGRKPNTDMLELETAGIRTDSDGFIMTNDHLQTNMPRIYALGDVRGGPAFTHISYDDFRVIRANLLEDDDATINNRFVPYVIYTDPELGRIGLTENEAREQGYDIKVGTIPMRHVARAIEMGETRGLMKVIVDAESDQILGFAGLGVHGGEVMSVVEAAMMGDVPYTAIRDGIFAHPTLTESLNNLFMTIDD